MPTYQIRGKDTASKLPLTVATQAEHMGKAVAQVRAACPNITIDPRDVAAGAAAEAEAAQKAADAAAA
jgi:hypothetical protein